MVKIGLVAPFEGLHRNLGYEALYAVKLAIRQHNAAAAGGPLVELVALDDTQNPSYALEQARELTLDPDILGVVGHFSRLTTAAALPEYTRAGLALVIPVAMPAIAGGMPEHFRGEGQLNAEAGLGPFGVRHMVVGEQEQGAVAARFVVGVLDARRLVIVQSGSDALARGFVSEAQARGADVRLATWPDEALVSALVQDSPEAIFFTGDPVAGAEFLLQAREAGLAAPVVGSSAWGDPTFARLVGDAADGAFYATLSPDLDSMPAGRQFVEDYMAYAGQVPGRQAALAHDAAQLLLAAIARASADGGTPTRETVVRQMLELRSYSGAAGEYRFDEQGEQLLAPLPEIIPVTERRF